MNSSSRPWRAPGWRTLTGWSARDSRASRRQDLCSLFTAAAERLLPNSRTGSSRRATRLVGKQQNGPPVVAAQRKDEGSPAIELPGEAADEYDDEERAVVVRKVTAWSFEELPDLPPPKKTEWERLIMSVLWFAAAPKSRAYKRRSDAV